MSDNINPRNNFKKSDSDIYLNNMVNELNQKNYNKNYKKRYYKKKKYDSNKKYVNNINNINNVNNVNNKENINHSIDQSIDKSNNQTIDQQNNKSPNQTLPINQPGYFNTPYNWFVNPNIFQNNPNQTNQNYQNNQTNQVNQVNQVNQNNQSNPPVISNTSNMNTRLINNSQHKNIPNRVPTYSYTPYYQGYYHNYYPYPMITNFSQNSNIQSSQKYLYNVNRNNQLCQYKNKNDMNQLNQMIREYIGEINKINDEIKAKEINTKKEFKWLKLEIKTLDDLIKISKDYGIKYSKDYEYQIDLDQLSNMVVELESLNNLIGLSGVKTQIVDLILYYSLKLDNKNYDLLHTVIEGDPGTGKTELAEKLAKIYLKMGILKKDVFKKVRRSDLIAGYLGQTAIKTEKVLEECKGGVLFIDEAYSLGNAEGKDGRDSFSKECIDMLNQWLTENKSEFICIIAGYKDDLTKSFFSYNTGLERRFPIRFQIDNYTDEELARIFVKKVRECEWDIDYENLAQIIKSNRKYFKFNGGDMEILFAKSKIAHSKNLLLIQDKKKKVLTEADIVDGVKMFLENPEIKKRGEDSVSKYLIDTMYC